MAKKVNIQELSRRYTTAIFELAKSQNALDSVAAELDGVTALLAENQELQKMLNSPLLSAAEQVTTVSELARSNKLSPLATNFLLVVANNRRMANLNDIIRAFRERIAEEKNEVTAEVTTAEKLSDGQLKELSAELGKKTGKTVVIEEKIDDTVIGGLVVKIGSKMFDYSVRARLNKLRNQLKSAG